MFRDPVFILAPPRSYTSLVCAVIGQHPELYGLPELNLFQCETLGEFWSGRNADGSLRSPFWSVMRHGLLRTVAQAYAGEQTVPSIEMAKRWIRTRKDVPTPEVYKELCRKAAPLWLVEKSPAYLGKRRYLERLLDTFPDARFIHLLRHPRGQCESVLNVKGGPLVLFMMNGIDRTGDRPVLDPQILWHDSQVRILNFLEPLPEDRWIRVQGEAFMNDMDRTLLRICEWLGVSTSPEALERMKHPEESPFSCVGPVNARLGNDPNFLESPALRPGGVKEQHLDGPLAWRPDQATFHPRVVELAQEMGYR